MTSDASEAAAPLQKRANYLVRHWRGDLSLPLSYWVNGWLATLAGIAAGFAVRLFVHPTDSVAAWALAMIAAWIFVIGSAAWQVVGVWRSAGKHKARGGSGFWAGAARLMMVIGTLGFLRVFIVQGVPQLHEIWNIATGDPLAGPHKLRVLRNGTELEFAGGISFGVTGEVIKALDATPSIHVIHLNSLGGRIEEARKLRDLIHERHLTTYSATGCASACTIAFMGGEQRVIAPTAKLGFHRGAFPGVTDALIAIEIEPDKRAFMAAGVDRGFVDRAFSTPNDTIWWPTTDELKAAKVITAIASPSDFAVSGFDPTDPASMNEVEKGMLKTPIFSAIHDADPAAYAQIRAAVLDGMQAGKSQSEITGLARSTLSKLLSKYLPVSSDDAVIDVTEVTIAEIDQIRAKSADACYAFLFPDARRPPVVITQYVARDVLQRESDADAAAIRSGLSGLRTIPGTDQIAPSRTAVLQSLMKKYPLNDIRALSDPALRDKDHAKSCELTSAFYREILALPKSEAAQFLRFLYGKGAS